MKRGRGDYRRSVWRNGAGLCGGATRRGIFRPGRKQVRSSQALLVRAIRACGIFQACFTGADHESPLADETHNWDANGNQSGGSITILPDNILQEDANFLYEHDADGNLTKKTDKLTGDYTLYGWDFRNRLTSVEFYDDEDVLLKRVEYDYDVFDRRIAKRVDENGDTVFERAEKYVYDGEDIVLVFDATDSLTDRFLHGPGIDEVFADERFIDDVFDDTYYPLTDHLGSIRDVAVYDSILEETSIAKHLTLDSFGKILDDSAPTLRFLYAFTGREWDPDAQLYYFRARWMSPDMRQFIGKDPIGFSAGDTNTGRYVGNFVTGAVDPSGLSDSMQGVDSDLQLAIDRSNREALNNVVNHFVIPRGQAMASRAWWWLTRTTVFSGFYSFNLEAKKGDIRALDETLTFMKDTRFGDPTPMFIASGEAAFRATSPGIIIVNGIDIGNAAVANDSLSRAVAEANSRRHGAEQFDMTVMALAGEAFALSPRGVCPPARPPARIFTPRELRVIEEMTAEFRAAEAARQAYLIERGLLPIDSDLYTKPRDTPPLSGTGQLSITDDGLIVINAPKQTISLGVDAYLDDFSRTHGANSWKVWAKDDPLNWKGLFLREMNNPNNRVLFNLDGVDVWGGLSRGATPRATATDWELAQIFQNRDWWSRIRWIKHGKEVPNPFE